MKPIICCPSVEVLRWFLAASKLSVVHAAYSAFEGAFPSELRSSLAKETRDPDLAVSTVEALGQVAKRAVVHEEILIFRGDDLMRSYVAPPLSQEDVFVELLRLFQQPSYKSAKGTRKVEAVLQLVREITLGGSNADALPVSRARETDLYRVLEIGPDATPSQIDEAYRRMVKQYHPDKAAQLGRKLRELAEAETKAINNAYEVLRKRTPK